MSKSIKLIAALEIATVFGSALLVLGVVPMIIELDPITTQIVVWFIYLLGMGLIWYFQERGGEWRTLGLETISNWGVVLKRSIIVALVSMMAFVLIGAIAFKLNLITGSLDFSGYDYLEKRWWMPIVILLAVYISSSFGEEVVYRGFLITRLMKIFQGFRPKLCSVVISGLIFGLAHWSWGPLGVLQTAAMGWALGYFYLRYKRQLWINVIAHAILDTILFLQLV